MISREALTFLAVGLLTVLIDALTYRLLSQVLALPWAKALGFLTGTVFAYVANRKVTFRQRQVASGSVWRFMVLYGLALLLNTAINSTMINLLKGWLDDPAVRLTVAFVVATGASAIWNFVGMKWFVFKPAALTLERAKV
jgi:putative flippase GtrA